MLFVFGYRASKIRSKKISVLIHNSNKHSNLNSCTVSVHFQRIIDKVTYNFVLKYIVKVYNAIDEVKLFLFKLFSRNLKETTKLFQIVSLSYLGLHLKIVLHIMSLIKRKCNLRKLLRFFGLMESIWITIGF